MFDSSKKVNLDENESYLLRGYDNELLKLQKNKNSHFNNPVLAHLSINSLRHKIIDLREILKYTGIDFISLSETKLDDTFPDAQFTTDNYISFRRDRNQFGGGLFTFVKKDFFQTGNKILNQNSLKFYQLKLLSKRENG